MVRGAVWKKRPCSICRRWFLPDARVGDRQRACGAEERQRARHRAADRAWRARHPEYDRGRRWQAAVESAKAGRPVPAPLRPSVLAGVPWNVAQDAMNPEIVVILAGIAQVLAFHAQDARRRQVRKVGIGAERAREARGVEVSAMTGAAPFRRFSAGRIRPRYRPASTRISFAFQLVIVELKGVEPSASRVRF